MSLTGRTILIARPEAQAAGLESLLQAAGAQALRLPVLAIQPDAQALATLAAQAARADWLFFVSPSAIDLAWPMLAAQPLTARLACVGASSARKLGALAQRAVLYPQEGSDSAALLAEPALGALHGQRCLIVRGVNGSPLLGATLTARGAQVDYADIYQRIDALPDWTTFDRLATAGELDGCIVTSSEIVERLFRLAGRDRVPALQCLQYCVPHPRIAERLAAQGVARIVTTRADDAAMVAGLKEWFSRHP